MMSNYSDFANIQELFIEYEDNYITINGYMKVQVSGYTDHNRKKSPQVDRELRGNFGLFTNAEAWWIEE